MIEQKKIILVEDDQELAQLITEYMTYQGFTVDIIDDGLVAVDAIIAAQPSLVILDLNLPGRDGLSICRAVRGQYQGPILMLTASDEMIDQVMGLELGADDYVNKPVEPRVLLARIRALLRRTEAIVHNQSRSTKGLPPDNIISAYNTCSNNDILIAGEVKINSANRVVYFKGNEIELSTPEYELLIILTKKSGNIVSRLALFEQIKGYDYDGISRFIDILVSQLRQKLSENTIKTVRGKGYLLIK